VPGQRRARHAKSSVYLPHRGPLRRGKAIGKPNSSKYLVKGRGAFQDGKLTEGKCFQKKKGGIIQKVLP